MTAVPPEAVTTAREAVAAEATYRLDAVPAREIVRIAIEAAAPLIAAQAAAAERERIRQLAIETCASYYGVDQATGQSVLREFADLIGEERRLADGDGWDTARDRITEANQARADERERIATELEQRADGLDRHVGEWSDIGARHEVTTLAVTLRNTAAAIRANGLTENLRGDMDWR